MQETNTGSGRLLTFIEVHEKVTKLCRQKFRDATDPRGYNGVKVHGVTMHVPDEDKSIDGEICVDRLPEGEESDVLEPLIEFIENHVHGKEPKKQGFDIFYLKGGLLPFLNKDAEAIEALRAELAVASRTKSC